MDRRKFRPGVVEPLETLTLLSSAMPHLSPALMLEASHSPAPQLRLNGALSGTYTNHLTIDTGSTHNLSGSGQVAALGHVSVRGDVERTGYILFKNRPVNGTLVLSNAQGTVTLSLHSTNPHNETGDLPANIPFTVTGGTGQYAHLTDHGTAHITLQNSVGPRSHSGFTLTLTSAQGR